MMLILVAVDVKPADYAIAVVGCPGLLDRSDAGVVLERLVPVEIPAGSVEGSVSGSGGTCFCERGLFRLLCFFQMDYGAFFGSRCCGQVHVL